MVSPMGLKLQFHIIQRCSPPIRIGKHSRGNKDALREGTPPWSRCSGYTHLIMPSFPGMYYYLLKSVEGFPGGAVVENPPANAGDTGSSPGLGRSHMPRSGWAREPQLLSLRVWSLCSATREAAIVRGPRTVMKSGPRSPQLEKALARKRRPNTAKNNK